jgi:hypothetical protein
MLVSRPIGSWLNRIVFPPHDPWVILDYRPPPALVRGRAPADPSHRCRRRPRTWQDANDSAQFSKSIPAVPAPGVSLARCSANSLTSQVLSRNTSARMCCWRNRANPPCKVRVFTCTKQSLQNVEQCTIVAGRAANRQVAVFDRPDIISAFVRREPWVLRLA